MRPVEIDSRAAIDRSCRKRKEEYIELGKEDKTLDDFGEEERRFRIKATQA
jgi:hypothetical protein